MSCPTCGSSSVLHDQMRGEIVCTRCGLVILERLLDPGPEWRIKNTEESGRADVGLGSDVTQHDLGLGTTFSVPADVSPSVRASLRRMGKLQRRSRVFSWKDRSLRDVLVDLDKMCELLRIPKGMKAEASVLYRRVMSKGLTVGRDHMLVLSAIVFLICRAKGLPRRCEEIAEAVGKEFGNKRYYGTKAVRRIAKLISREMNLKPKRVGASEYLERFSAQLGLRPDVIASARNLLTSMPDSVKRGKSPILLAAISIYLGAWSCGEKLTLKNVAGVAGVGVSTISKNISLIRRHGGAPLSSLL